MAAGPAAILAPEKPVALTENVHNLQAVEIATGSVTPMPFDQTLANTLFAHGYGQVVLFDQVRSFQSMTSTIAGDQEIPSGALPLPSGASVPQGPEALAVLLPQLLRHEGATVALIELVLVKLSSCADTNDETALHGELS